jgi:hypothetical protein
MEALGNGDMEKRLLAYLGFWVVSGVALLVLGVATFAALHHGHRVGVALGALSVPCFAVAYLIRRAPRRQE